MTNSSFARLTGAALCSAAIICGTAFNIAVHAADPPAIADIVGGWKTIAGGPGTGCATDATPYEFYVHEGDPRRIAIYFQGGGACWNSKNCGLDGRSTFEGAVDAGDYPWAKGQANGILDIGNKSNPLHGFTIVMAPYCSADVHLGVGTVRYEASEGKRLDVHYRGLANSQRVTDWVTQHYKDPKQVFVAGGSAGAIPSPIFASQLARFYKRARVVQLGDGAGGYRSARVSALLDLWGASRSLKHDPLYRDLDVATANFEDFYARAASVSNLQLAQVNAIEDGVQIFFLGQLGHQVTTLAPLLSGDLAEVRRTNPKFRTFVMPGAMHTVLTRPEFYTTTVDDIALAKWVADLVNGRSSRNVGDSLLVGSVNRLK